ncbi:MAG TPA: DegT/DnrJ/EryC1/StrS family aminotransferase [Gemmataceae bacterium]|jgi:dTDP-4-amino-4,6-dideoxygalactose transaminase|nr:DegT/DnrJ/EryC1/StrS family aminotransferase [Gemmataceae bacterium]
MTQKGASRRTNDRVDDAPHQQDQPSFRVSVGDIRIGPKERNYVNQVLDSSRLSYGPFSQKFESLFASLHDCKYAIFCNSGTSALHIALAALKERHGWEDGDEVIVPAVTFIATSNIVLHNHMKPVFVDVDSQTYNLDPTQIEAHITPRTRAIIPVHLMGLPADMAPILDIAHRHDLRVIEDSCETMFAGYRGRKVGSWSDVGCFSTYIAHYIVTGVGGLATTNDAELAVHLKSLMNHGRDSIYLTIDDDANCAPEKLFEIAARRFRFVSLGHSFRCTELEAAIGLAQLEDKDAIVERRKAVAAAYIKKLEPLSEWLQLPTIPPDRDHVFMLFPLVVRDGNKRPLINFLEANGIETRDLLPLLNQPIYRKLFGNLEPHYPVAQWLNRSGFYIGCHQYIDEAAIKYVTDKFCAFFEQQRRQAA